MGEPDATPPPRPLLSRPSRRYSRADAGSSGRARNESSIAAIRANRLSFIGGALVSEAARALWGGASCTASGARGAARSREHATRLGEHTSELQAPSKFACRLLV